ncbi:hypothetical protein D5086_010930 [Populus alba]|uniref:Uncharacterized protein n=2 Tax=Populus alba TaxID=43335 RepID=A0ACC4CCI3_POPAL|nr:uncharacterized protein LOC118050466 [Populus alba]TKS11687.1 hypothetical protein D5086_0000070940 [Populus alba]
MASLWRSKEVKGRSKPDRKCKKHPKHEQPPGVCSVCLIEKLSQLPTSATSSTSRIASLNTMDSSSSCSLSSYSSFSSYSSPTHRFQHPAHGKGSFPLFFNGKNMFLAKSRSLAFVPRRGNKDCHEKKKGGFWSKLLRLPKGEKVEEGLVHSRTMRERVIIISTS